MNKFSLHKMVHYAVWPDLTFVSPFLPSSDE